MALNVFLISDFNLLIEGISVLLHEQRQDFFLAGIAPSLSVAIKEMKGKAIDLILLDIDSQQDQIVPSIQNMETASRAKILLMTRLDDIELQDEAIKAGAHGVIKKDNPLEHFFIAMQKVAAGEIWLDRAATGRLFVEFSHHHDSPQETAEHLLDTLTHREREIIEHVTRSNAPGKVIADALHISESTLRNHLSAIYEKLGVHNRRGLLSFAFEYKLIKNHPPSS